MYYSILYYIPTDCFLLVLFQWILSLQGRETGWVCLNHFLDHLFWMMDSSTIGDLGSGLDKPTQSPCLGVRVSIGIELEEINPLEENLEYYIYIPYIFYSIFYS